VRDPFVLAVIGLVGAGLVGIFNDYLKGGATPTAVVVSVGAALLVGIVMAAWLTRSPGVLRGLVGGLVAVMLMLVGIPVVAPSVLPWPDPHASTTPTPASTVVAGAQKPVVTITEPQLDAQVSYRAQIRGTAQFVPEGLSLWIIVYVNKNNEYWPQWKATVAHGEWHGWAIVGQANSALNGNPYEILAVLADASADDSFGAWFIDKDTEHPEALARLPAGATRAASHPVTLKYP